MKYFGSFRDRDSIVSAFETDQVPPEEAILFAAYDGGGWDGYAMVVFETDGKLFEVEASHCSCYGMEGQWEPEETSWEALAIRECYGLDRDAKDALKALCASRVQQ